MLRILIFISIVLYGNDIYSQKKFYKTAKIMGVVYSLSKDVISTMDGGYIYLALEDEFMNGLNVCTIHVVKTDSIGDVSWSTAFTTSAFRLEPFSMVEMKNGDLTILGKVGFEESFVMRVDKNGIYKWVKKYHTFSPANFNSTETKAIVTADGGIAITGIWGSVNTNDKGEIYLLKMNDQGEVQWASKINSPKRAIGYDIVENAKNELIVVGSNFGNNFTVSNIYGAKFNSEGVMIWAQDFGLGLGATISQSSSNEYIISTFVVDSTSIVFKITDQGGILWAKKLVAGIQKVIIKQATKPKDFRLVFGGYTVKPDDNSTFTLNRGMVCEITSDGEIKWAKKYGVLDGSGAGIGPLDLYMRVALAQDGGYILTGNDNFFYEDEIYMIKTDKVGNAGCNSLEDISFKSLAFTIIKGNSLLTTPITITTAEDTFSLVSNSVIVNTICATVSTDEPGSKEIVSLYPNPATDFITVQTEDYKNRNLAIRVFNSLGIQRGIFEFYHGNISTVDITSLLSGQYFYEVIDNDSVLKRGLLMIIK